MECDAKYISLRLPHDLPDQAITILMLVTLIFLVKRWSPEHEAWASQVTEKKWKIRKEVGELWMDTDESDVFLFAYAFVRWIYTVKSVYVRTQVNFARVNETEAMHGRSRVNVNVPRHFMYCLYFIYMYVRKSFLLAQGIISRDWKSTCKALEPSFLWYFSVVRFLWSINWVKWM